MTDTKNEHLLFLTGKLAENRLRKVLESMQPVEFSYEIRNIGVSVAALMTVQMLIRRLNNLEGVDRIILPGRLGGRGGVGLRRGGGGGGGGAEGGGAGGVGGGGGGGFFFFFSPPSPPPPPPPRPR